MHRPVSGASCMRHIPMPWAGRLGVHIAMAATARQRTDCTQRSLQLAIACEDARQTDCTNPKPYRVAINGACSVISTVLRARPVSQVEAVLRQRHLQHPLPLASGRPCPSWGSTARSPHTAQTGHDLLHRCQKHVTPHWQATLPGNQSLDRRSSPTSAVSCSICCRTRTATLLATDHFSALTYC